DVEVRPVQSRADRRRFINDPYDRHRGDPHWIPPLRLGEYERLNPAKNPFLAHADLQLFLAWRDGRVAGRIAAIDDRLHTETHRDNTAMFGFFEAADAETAAALLAAVERWAAARGRSQVRGPINPSLNDSCGLLIDGFDTDPMLLMPHNPPTYAAFIEAAGYRKVKDLYAWLYDLAQPLPAPIARVAQRQREKLRLTFRPIRMAEFARDVDRL